MKNELLNPSISSNEDIYSQNINLVNEMSGVLRKNIVQGLPTEDGKFREFLRVSVFLMP